MTEDRRSDRYWEWRRAVLKRDKHKCQWPHCKRRTKLQVHHIVTWATSASLRYVVSNGISLCVKHHAGIKNKEHHFAEMFRVIISVQGKITKRKSPSKRKI